MLTILLAMAFVGQPEQSGLTSSIVLEDELLGFISDIAVVDEAVVVTGSGGVVTLDAELRVTSSRRFAGIDHPLASPSKQIVHLRPDGQIAFLDSDGGSDTRTVSLHAADGSLLWRAELAFPEQNAYAGAIRSVVPMTDSEGLLDVAAVTASGNDVAVLVSAAGVVLGEQTWEQTNDVVGAIGVDVIGDNGSEVLYCTDSSLVCVDREGRKIFSFSAKNSWSYINRLTAINDDKDAGVPEFLVGVNETDRLGIRNEQQKYVIVYDVASGEVLHRPATELDTNRAGSVPINGGRLKVGPVAEEVGGEQRHVVSLAARLFDEGGGQIHRLTLETRAPGRNRGATVVVRRNGNGFVLSGWVSTLWRIEVQ